MARTMSFALLPFEAIELKLGELWTHTEPSTPT